jgi:hypothetical protein
MIEYSFGVAEMPRPAGVEETGRIDVPVLNRSLPGK